MYPPAGLVSHHGALQQLLLAIGALLLDVVDLQVSLLQPDLNAPLPLLPVPPHLVQIVHINIQLFIKLWLCPERDEEANEKFIHTDQKHEAQEETDGGRACAACEVVMCKGERNVPERDEEANEKCSVMDHIAICLFKYLSTLKITSSLRESLNTYKLL